MFLTAITVYYVLVTYMIYLFTEDPVSGKKSGIFALVSGASVLLFSLIIVGILYIISRFWGYALLFLLIGLTVILIFTGIVANREARNKESDKRVRRLEALDEWKDDGYDWAGEQEYDENGERI